MADIFISYAHEDKERVAPIVDELEKIGWSVFWDKKIPAGERWHIYIAKALGDSQCVLVVWSKHSIVSESVIEEALVAKEKGVLVPICLDRVELPLGFKLIQAPDLSDWGNNSSHQSFLDLQSDITSRISSSKPSLPTASPSSQSKVLSAVPKLKIGDNYGGGKVAFIDATGQHGVIAAEADLPGGDKYSWEAAKKACSDLRENGYSDWRLPSKEELNQLYINRSAVGGFADVNYWSSTEYDATTAQTLNFGSGDQSYASKYGEWRVRPVRAF